MSRPRLLDLFCGAGGASVGYARAGFDVEGIDIAPQPDYPFDFIQADALRKVAELLDANNHGRFDAIHASPPCQPHVKGLRAVNEALGREFRHLDLVAETRRLLEIIGLPYVIENVPGAPLRDPMRLCGTSFGLPLRRHRIFESNVAVALVPRCAHHLYTEPRYWTSWVKKGKRTRATTVQVYGNGAERDEWGPAMGIDWMTPDEMAEAIPPAYTEWIGAHLMDAVRSRAA